MLIQILDPFSGPIGDIVIPAFLLGVLIVIALIAYNYFGDAFSL